MNSGSRSSAINILVGMTMLFFAAAVTLSMMHVADGLTNHAWGAFEGMSGALLLILKSDSDHHDPTPPADPAKTK